jgi:hypothetical protein
MTYEAPEPEYDDDTVVPAEPEGEPITEDEFGDGGEAGDD